MRVLHSGKTNQEYINNTCERAGLKYLKSQYRKIWSIDKPTTGYCYIISEILYHYYYTDSKPYYINLLEHGNHWFLKVNDNVVDYTANQFDFDIPYIESKRCAFFKGKVKTERGFISIRAQKMYEEFFKDNYIYNDVE